MCNLGRCSGLNGLRWILDALLVKFVAQQAHRSGSDQLLFLKKFSHFPSLFYFLLELLFYSSLDKSQIRLVTYENEFHFPYSMWPTSALFSCGVLFLAHYIPRHNLYHMLCCRFNIVLCLNSYRLDHRRNNWNRDRESLAKALNHCICSTSTVRELTHAALHSCHFYTCTFH